MGPAFQLLLQTNSGGITPHHTNFHNLYDTLRVIRVVLQSPRFPRGRG